MAVKTFVRRGGSYVILQLALLFMILLRGWRHRPASAVPAGLGLMLVGLLLALLGGQRLGRHLTPVPEPVNDGQLVTTGIYGLVRHPIYGGILLMAAGWSVWRGSRESVGWTAALGFLFHLKAGYEERLLQSRYPGYSAYQRRVKRFLPWLY